VYTAKTSPISPNPSTPALRAMTTVVRNPNAFEITSEKDKRIKFFAALRIWSVNAARAIVSVFELEECAE
jgi:hypothetical protein